MARAAGLTCSKTLWHGRQAWALENGLIRLVSLTGGGHIAELRFMESSGKPSLNPLWMPPWKTIEPYHYKAKLHQSRYGPPGVGKTLSGIAGHNICLDYFGMPSEEEAARGLSIHGEAPCAKWAMVQRRSTALETDLTLSARMPVAGLRLNREIRVLRNESVVYFKETVFNERDADHFFHWTQHVTLGPPFLSHREARVAISAMKGRTWCHGYDHNDLLKSSREFRWPSAPGVSGTVVDLAHPFSQHGSGFLASLLLDPRREIEFVSALNTRHRLLIAYCFRRADFPWVAVWEENQARREPPWKGRSQARGLEFSSTPFPVGRREAFANGPLFGTPTLSMAPARGRKTIRYIAVLAEVPEGFEDVGDIRIADKEVQIFGAGKGKTMALAAAGRW
jgi:hypothetical protein